MIPTRTLSNRVGNTLDTGRGTKLHRAIERRIALDTRSLAAFRMGMGGLLVADVLLRSRNFHFFYTDRGAVPLDLAMSLAPEHAVSFYFLSGSWHATAALFLAQLIAGVFLIIGWRTRSVAVLSFLLVASLCHRNVLVTSYSDILLLQLLFFALFLPLGERWSIDAMRRKHAPRPQVVGLASFLILLQMVLMYLVNGYHKHQDSLWQSGEALPVILAHDSITFPLGDFLGQFTAFLTIGGLFWLSLLTVSFLLLLLTDRSRTVVVVAFVATHALLAVTVRIGEFSYVAMAGLLLFLPAVFWRDIDRVCLTSGFPMATWRAGLATVARRTNTVLPRIPRPSLFEGRPAVRRAGSAVVLVILAVAGADMVVVNLQTVGYLGEDAGPVQHAVDDYKKSFGIDQPDWSIFAPNTSVTDSWIIVAVETTSGERSDVFNNRPLSFERPDRPSAQWHTYRERFYWEELEHRAVGDHYRDSLCQRGTQSDNGGSVAYITVYEVSEEIDPNRPETFSHPELRSKDVDVLYVGACDGRTPIIVE